MSAHIGNLPTDGDLGKRDAFHAPAVLVNCGEALVGGDKVCFLDDSLEEVYLSKVGGEYHGIVNPFVETVEPYESVWVLLAPGIVDKLSHHFTVSIPGLPRSYSNMDSNERAVYDSCKGCW